MTTSSAPADTALEAARPWLAVAASELAAQGWDVDDDISNGVCAYRTSRRKNGANYRTGNIQLYWSPVTGYQIDFSTSALTQIPILAVKPWTVVSSTSRTRTFKDFISALKAFRELGSPPPST